jgi:hypothetical protein
MTPHKIVLFDSLALGQTIILPAFIMMAVIFAGAVWALVNSFRGTRILSTLIISLLLTCLGGIAVVFVAIGLVKDWPPDGDAISTLVFWSISFVVGVVCLLKLTINILKILK